jgi:calcineurin-like phosphoesterase family protein
MSNVRFISDLHLGHENQAIKRRGFPDIYNHDEYIITRWNLTVHKKDLTFILGDLTMEKCTYENFKRLTGRKVIVGGNHDPKGAAKYLLDNQLIEAYIGCMKYKSKQYGKFWLTHIPIHPKELDYKVNYNIHGHIHNGKIEDKRYINVCAEVIDYKPKLLSELMHEK